MSMQLLWFRFQMNKYLRVCLQVMPVLELAEREVRIRQLIPANLTIKWIPYDDKCDPSYATISAMDGYGIDCGHVLFGPTCDYALGKRRQNTFYNLIFGFLFTSFVLKHPFELKSSTNRINFLGKNASAKENPKQNNAPQQWNSFNCNQDFRNAWSLTMFILSIESKLGIIWCCMLCYTRLPLLCQREIKRNIRQMIQQRTKCWIIFASFTC